MDALARHPRFRPRLQRLARPLLSLPTGPFHEGAIASFLVEQAARLRLDCERDVFGNLLVRYRRGRPSGSVAWMAHMDHPALETVGPGRGKGAYARVLGHVTPRYLRGARIVIPVDDAPPLRARVAAVPRSRWEEERLVRLEADDPVPAGHLAVFDLPGYRMVGSRIHSRQCDDLAGVAAVVMALEELVRRKASAEVWGVFTRAEEKGFIGATGLARSGLLEGDQPVISVECSAERPTARLGRGFVVRTGDHTTSFDPLLVHALSRIARSMVDEHPGFRCQRALMDGGACEASALIAFGLRAAAVCLPLGNYHNMAADGRLAPEVIHADDLAHLVAFIVETAVRRREIDRAPRELRRRFERRHRAYAHRLLGRSTGAKRGSTS